MAVPFTFGQSLLAGLQAGNQNRQAAEELALRRKAQEDQLSLGQAAETRLREHGDRGLDLQKVALDHNLYKTNLDYSLGDRAATVSEAAARLNSGRFVDFEIGDGQTGKIAVEDLLGDRRARMQLRLQEDSFRPLTVTNDMQQALSDILSGKGVPGGSQTFDPRLAPIVGQYLAQGSDSIERRKREEAERYFAGNDAVQDFAADLFQASPIDANKIAPKLGRFDRFAVGAESLLGYLAPFASDAAHERVRMQSAIGTTIPEFQRVMNEQTEMMRRLSQIDPRFRPQAAQVAAERSTDILNDVAALATGANISKEEREALHSSINQMVRFHSSNMPQGNPVVKGIMASIDLAMEKEDYTTAAKLYNSLINLGKVEGQTAVNERKLQMNELEATTGLGGR